MTSCYQSEVRKPGAVAVYLLDTNVVSETRKAGPHGAVVAWLSEQSATDLYLSAMTIAELQQGIELTRDQNPSRAQEIETWLERILLPSTEVLAMDSAVCRTWARLMHHRSDTLAEDAFIAATAIVHGLTVVSRNVRDFEALGIVAFNPFEFNAS